MFRALRPVGEAVTVEPSDRSIESVWPLGEQWDRQFFVSGTAALAAACEMAVQDSAIDNPEIIIPAYTCPDVVSAVEKAGAIPVIVDLEINSPQMSLKSVRESVRHETVAIIPVNFLGIPERIQDLRHIAEKRGIIVIYDHAQGFAKYSNDVDIADAVVFSFGRGKPASALVGGALLVNRKRLSLENVYGQRSQTNRLHKTKVNLYNFFLRPNLYWVLPFFPMLKLGETRYRRLDTVEKLEDSSVGLIAANIESYIANTCAVERRLHEAVKEFDMISLLHIVDRESNGRLLRYPVLFRSHAQREHALQIFQKLSLGVTTMYPTVLNELPDLANKVYAHRPVPNAQDFANRLVTLPCHSGVLESDIANICKVLEEVLCV